MGTIVERTDKNGKTRYLLRIRRRGAKPVNETFDTKTAAKARERELDHKVDKGAPLPDRKAESITVAFAIDHWLAKVAPEKSKQEQLNASRILTWWKDRVGPMYLSRLDSTVIDKHLSNDLRGGQKVRGGTRSDATVNRYRSFLSRVLGVCVKQKWIPENPVALVTKYEETTGRTRFLSNEEVDKLWALVRARGKPDFALFVAFAISTGARRGEIGKLEWRDFDMNTEHVTYRKTKNKDTRTVAMPSLLVKELKQYRASLPAHPLPTVKVFKHHYFHDWRQVEPHFDEFVFHDLRHTAASAAANDGASLFQIAQMLGHKTMAMVQRYSHLTDKTQRDLVNKVAAQNLR